jgi:hypothetical protein
MPTPTVERPAKRPANSDQRAKKTRTDREIRAARAAGLRSALAACVVGAVLTLCWVLGKTWRRLLPAYWAGAALAVAGIAALAHLRWTLVALVVALTVTAVGGLPARSLPVRLYRITVTGVLGLFAVATTAAGPDTLTEHATLAVFGPCLAAAVLGWPWWHQLRRRPPQRQPQAEPMPDLTDYWAGRWHCEVVEQGVCTGTRLVKAVEPRPGVTEAVIRLSPGTKPKAILGTGPDIEVALDLDEGAVGWRRTGKAAKISLTLVERSYIADGVAWTGPTYRDGRCQLTTFTDGTAGHWTFIRPGFGTLNGLVVGSTGAGKSRALGVLLTNLLDAGWMVAVGDPQNGMSLPAWRDAAGEYHQGVDPVKLLIRRLHAEVMRRSEMLSAVGVEVFDENDPRVQALGLKKLAAVIDECQMVLLANDKEFIVLVEEVVAIDRKTGVSIIFATQIPQMKSLGGSIRIRDAVVAGNCFIMRLSNRGSGTTVLPDDFVGDPFALPKEINGKTTAGMGYLRDAPQLGMLSRVPMLDEAAAAASARRTAVQWQVPPIDPTTPLPKIATAGDTTTSGAGGAVGRLRAAFGIGGTSAAAITVAPAQPASTPEWVLACLRRAPASAQALLDRPDCPVKQPQLYAVLDRLAAGGRITKPAQRGGPYTLA